MSKKCAAELLEAQDEETSQERLSELWSTSRSIKVRKAVASNPNAGPAVLKAASRLYLEEVVQNPGFEMLQLFDAGDGWIKDIADAYNDPDTFIMSQSIYYWSRSNIDSYLRACLLSKKLSAISLDRVVENISKTSLRRVIKNPEVREHVRYIIRSQLDSYQSWPFCLESIISLYMEKVISKEELGLCLYNYGYGSTSARRGAYTAFVRRLEEEYINAKTPEDKDLATALVTKIILISRSHTLNWMYHGTINSSLLEWSGELYSNVLRLIIKSDARRTLISDNVRWVGNVVASYLRLKFFTDEDGVYLYTKDGLEAAFEFIKKYELTGEKFSNFGFLLHKQEAAEQLLDCSLEAKSFFIRAGCLGSWTSAIGNDPRSVMANQVNDAIYDREGITNNLLFNKCSLRKIVALDEVTHIC